MKALSDSPNLAEEAPVLWRGYRKVKSPAEMPGPDDAVFWARAAAYIDGEGCMGIYLTRGGRRYGPPRYYTSVLTVANQDRRLTDWLVDHLGGGATPNGSKKRGKHELWQWRLNNRYLKHVIEQVRPFLLLKGEQADLMLEYLNRPKPTVRDAHADRLYAALKRAKRAQFVLLQIVE